MRVISGECKGLRLQTVEGTSTRPTTDKVKEAIFNMIGPYFDSGTVLDLFAGSGSLGIEALSRGVERAIFVDLNPKAVQVIKKNIEICKFNERVEVYRNTDERALLALIKRDITFTHIFLDPPYKKQQLESLITKIADAHLMTYDGIIVAEHDADVILPDNIRSFTRIKFETYGTIAVSVYHLEEGGN